MSRESKVQGEGDCEAARRYRKRTKEYLENNDVEKAAVRAAPDDARREAEDLKAAEAAGKQRAKGEDPAIRAARRIAGRAVDDGPHVAPLRSNHRRLGIAAGVSRDGGSAKNLRSAW